MASSSSTCPMPSQKVADISSSSRSKDSTTIPLQQASFSNMASFPIVSSPVSLPVPSSASLNWYLCGPSDSFSGLSFSSASSSSNSTLPVIPRRLSKSPYDQQRAATSAAARGSNRQGRIPMALATSVMLVENTLKLESLGVSSIRPEPSIAPKVTLSNKCQPDSKVIFDQNYFTSANGHNDASRKARRVRTHARDGDRGGSLAGIGEEEGESLHSSIGSFPSGDSGVPSTRNTNTLTSPTSTSSLLPVHTAATSFIPDGDSQSVTSTTSSIPASSRKPAWSTPRSWADMASREGNGPSGTSTTLAMPFSENITGLSPANGSPLQSDNNVMNAFTLDTRRQGQNGKTRAKETDGPIGLEGIFRQAVNRFSAPLTYPRGMINKGNLCFANAILQVLIYCAPFYNLFRLAGQHIAHDFHNSTPLMEAIIYFLSEFQQIPVALQKSLQETPLLAMDLLREIQASSEPFAPEYLYDAMKLNKRFDAMRRGHQEDAEEFLGFFLDTLHEELLIAIRKSSSNTALHRTAASGNHQGEEEEIGVNGIGQDSSEEREREVKRPVSPNEGDGWLEVGQKGKTSFTRTTSTAHSPITRIFGGKLRSILRTPGSKDSVTLEPYQPLQLDIQPAHVTTVEEALENLTIPETITGVHSASTKGPVDATKQVFIETLPPILILHMKRFVYDDIGGVQKSSKVLAYGPTLEISESTISPARRAEAKRRYKLFGVVYHHGKYASGGHYTVDVLKQDQSEWLHIDDTTWSSVSAPHVRGSSEGQSLAKQHHDGVAYLLFYAREDSVALLSDPVNGILHHPSHRRIASTTSNRGQGNKK